MEENTESRLSFFGLLWRGFAMGIAEVIPGVSGGTIAFITGIYERLLSAISGINVQLFHVLKNEGLTAFFKKADLFFILKLTAGMVVGIVMGITLVTKLLVTAPTVLWAFFFGLILASVIYMLNKVINKNIGSWILFLMSAIITYMVVTITPVSGSENLVYVFFCGAIAICALILPGISGSFILLLLGMYTYIIPKVKSLLSSFNTDDLMVVIIFGLGCLFGLLSFSKFLKYTFDKYRYKVMMILSGLMLGSLVKIWPWRNPMVIIHKESGEPISRSSFLSDPLNESYKLVSENNVLPADYLGDPMTLFALISLLMGFTIVIFSMMVEGPVLKSDPK